MKRKMNILSLLKRPTTAFLWAIMLVIASFMPAIASAAQAVATVSKNIVGVNEVFQLTVFIDDSVNTEQLDLSALDGNFIYGIPRIYSGKTNKFGPLSSYTQWKVVLATEKIGEFTIPSFRIGSSTTDPIVIQSLKSSKASSTNSTDPDIRFDAEIDKEQLYVGESLRYRLQIRTDVQIDQLSLTDPQGDGLNVTQIGDDRQAETVISGLRYAVFTRYYQITANKAGSILLQGAVFKGNIVKKNRRFGPASSTPVEKKTQNLTLEVKGKPAGYQGLWLPTPELQLEQEWQPQINSQPQKSEVRVGEPLTRIITLRIKNAAQSSMPNLSLQYPGSVRVYDEKPIYSSNDGFTSMTIKQVIIPREQGQLTLPALSINWWNTTTGQQETSKLNGLSIDVQPGDTSNTVSIPLAPALSDPRPADSSTTAEVKVVTDRGWWPWATALFATLWLITLVLWLRAKKNTQTAKHATTSTQMPTVANPVEQLIAAVKAGQPLRVQTYFQQWPKQHLSNDLIGQLEKEVAAMMAATYGKEKGTWDKAALLALLQQAQKSKAHAVKSPTLQPLVPPKT
ncbi:BatD family protein [Photobacterium sagamiensis]|uniref:BatD family protein n=1 Tax=Photobacterium sagamiensis TaxID=2910241 RepID=UPI003D13B8F1